MAIRLLYMLGEALPASHGAHFTGDATKASTLQEMMRTVSDPFNGGFYGLTLPPQEETPVTVCYNGRMLE